MGTFALDARYALRRLAHSPGFSAIAVLTLAIGIGASSTIFSVVNAVLLRPLPFLDPQGLIAVSQASIDTQAGGVPVSFTKYEAIREQARSLDGLAVYYPLNLSLGGESEPEQVAAARVTGDLFGVLGVTPARGRGFECEEEPDPLTFGGAVLVLTATALLACSIPALRGMRLQPLRALRDA